VSSLPYPISHDIDTQAELNDERYERALKVLSPSDVLATVDDLVAQILTARDHPCMLSWRTACSMAPPRAAASARM
jgi:hypothetical protein